jgi:hypothetical protein
MTVRSQFPRPLGRMFMRRSLWAPLACLGSGLVVSSQAPRISVGAAAAAARACITESRRSKPGDAH